MHSDASVRPALPTPARADYRTASTRGRQRSGGTVGASWDHPARQGWNETWLTDPGILGG